MVDTLTTNASFDLRQMLGGTQATFNGLIDMAHNTMSVTMESVPMLPLAASERSKVIHAIASAGSRNLLCVPGALIMSPPPSLSLCGPLQASSPLSLRCVPPPPQVRRAHRGRRAGVRGAAEAARVRSARVW